MSPRQQHRHSCTAPAQRSARTNPSAPGANLRGYDARSHRLPIFVHRIANPAAATPSVEPDGGRRASIVCICAVCLSLSVRSVRVRRGRPHGTDSERSGWDIESLLPLIMHGIDPLPHMWLPRDQKVPHTFAFLALRIDDLTSRGSAKRAAWTFTFFMSVSLSGSGDR